MLSKHTNIFFDFIDIQVTLKKKKSKQFNLKGKWDENDLGAIWAQG